MGRHPRLATLAALSGASTGHPDERHVGANVALRCVGRGWPGPEAPVGRHDAPVAPGRREAEIARTEVRLDYSSVRLNT